MAKRSQYIATALGLRKEFREPLLLSRDDERTDERRFVFDVARH
jgi:hypothetical protein